MRKQLSTTLLFLFPLHFLSLCGCGGSSDPYPSRQDEVREILTLGSWKIQSVTIDGVDYTSTYKNLALTFSSTDYTTVNGLPVWPSNGSWSFTDEAATRLRRDDGVEVTILQEASTSSLELGLQWNKATLSSGRNASIKGQYIFSFTK